MTSLEQLSKHINYGANLHGTVGVHFKKSGNRVEMHQSNRLVCVMTNLGSDGVRITGGVNDGHPFNSGENVSLANSLVTIEGAANDSDKITYNGLTIHEMPR
ncbi:hypothetical protein KBD69_02200 [Candidatus Woesebacteria bacterium]|nr:hypothetical protein [Candidatus Woesebacteria bacterium]